MSPLRTNQTIEITGCERTASESRVHYWLNTHGEKDRQNTSGQMGGLWQSNQSGLASACLLASTSTDQESV